MEKLTLSRKTTTCTWVVITVLSAGTVFMGFNAGWGVIKVTLVIIAYVLVIPFSVLFTKATIDQKVLRKKFANLQPLLDEKCDPCMYIKGLLPLMVKYRYILDQNNIFDICMNVSLVVAYIADGQNDTAMEAICGLAEKYRTKKIDTRMVFLINMALVSANIADKNLAEAKKHFKQAKLSQSHFSVQKLVIIRQKSTALFEQSITRIEAALTLLEKRYEEALTAHKQLWLMAQNSQHTKVAIQHNLAEAYEALGEIQKRDECLNYVANNGNTLHIARLAREKLR